MLPEKRAGAPPALRTIGIPIRGVNWVRLFAGEDAAGAACLYAVMGQQADNFMVLQIDPRSGQTRQYVAPGEISNYPTAAFWSVRRRTLYIGAAYSGHLLALDPVAGQIADLGAINPPGDIFPCRIDEAPDGRLWIGCYQTAGLTSYDPATRSFTRYGRMDETDMYCYPLVTPAGLVACEIKMVHPHVALLDPRSGAHHTVGPTITAGKAGQSLSLFRGTDAELYIRSSAGVGVRAGNYRLSASGAEPVATLPPVEPERALPDGSTFRFADAPRWMYHELCIENAPGGNAPGEEAAGSSRTLHLTYEGAGTRLFMLHCGPDDAVYGSSILPEHLFRYRTDTGDMVNLGACAQAGGEAYSMGNLDGKLYIASYPAAVLSVYDPARPYHFGEAPEDNPRHLGRMDAISYRPRAMLTGPLGRVWTASYPDYGLWGGPLAWYDPATGRFGSYRTMVGDLSCCALAAIGGSSSPGQALIAVGTSIQGGTGTLPKAEQATLFLWDPVAERKVWEGVLRCSTTGEAPMHTLNALVTGPDGLLYGTYIGVGETPPGLFVFDPASRGFVACLPLPPGKPLEIGLQVGPDGMLYGFTDAVFYRLDPATRALTEIVRAPGEFHIPGPIIGDVVYYGHLHELCSVRCRP